jgi:hypothetical protein
VLRLIYWDNVWNNFLRNNGQDMKKLNTLLSAIGISDDFHFKANNSTTRAELRAWFKMVNERLAALDDEKSKYVKSIVKQVRSTLFGLSRWSIPDSWVTGPSTEEPHYKIEVMAECKK